MPSVFRTQSSHSLCCTVNLRQAADQKSGKGEAFVQEKLLPGCHTDAIIWETQHQLLIWSTTV